MQEIVVDSNKPQKVNSICCYVCGREFGTKGFPFHYKQCLIKFSHEQNTKPNKDRVKLPEAPQGLTSIITGDLNKVNLKIFNQKSNQIFKYQVLPACKYCKRTFNYESLAVHVKGCAKKPTGYQEKENEIVESNPKVPKVLVCCVCGQRFGTTSLKIHYPECIKKFKNEEFRKHKRQSDRRAPPQFSPEDVASLFKTSWTSQQIQEFNARATENYRSHGMAECDNCGRKFFFEQYNKHRKNCQLINGKLDKGKVKPQEKTLKIVKPKTIMCIVCGRQYGTTSIVIHVSQCQQLFKKQQAMKPAAQRKKIATLSEDVKKEYDLSKIQEWSRSKIEQYNRVVFDVYNNKSLSKCYICQRTFFQDSLPKHLKDCESKLKDVKKLDKFKKHVQSNKNIFGQNFLDNVIQINRQLSTQQIKDVKKPKMLMCLLCGRQYGVASLKIHVPRCRGQTQQRKTELANLLQNIKLKYNINEAEKWSDEQIQTYNSEVSVIYKQKSLFECKYCHRTFFEESLKKHIKHCQKEHNKKSKVRRSKTMGAECEVDEQQQINECGQQVQKKGTLLRKQSSPIMEQEEDEISNHSKEQNYHALEYGTLIQGQQSVDQDMMKVQEFSIDQKMEVDQEEQKEQNISMLQAMEVQDF